MSSMATGRTPSSVLDLEESGRPLELPLYHNGHSYRATIEMDRAGWTVSLADENGVTLPASGDFAATLLALEGVGVSTQRL